MPLIARVILETAAALIALGGLYDLFAPRLAPNLAAICGGKEDVQKLVRELLRALGGALAAIGVTVAVVVANTSGNPTSPLTLVLVLLLVLPSEGINAYCMYRVNSPYYFPLAFVLLTL